MREVRLPVPRHRFPEFLRRRGRGDLSQRQAAVGLRSIRGQWRRLRDDRGRGNVRGDAPDDEPRDQRRAERRRDGDAARPGADEIADRHRPAAIAALTEWIRRFEGAAQIRGVLHRARRRGVERAADTLAHVLRVQAS